MSAPAEEIFAWEYAASDFGPIILRPRSGFKTPLSGLETLAPFVANDLLVRPTNGSIYDVPATAADSTVTLPEASALVEPPGSVFFSAGPCIVVFADGAKNAHTVQYRTPTKLLTPPLFGLKRHVVRLAAFAIRGEQPCWVCYVFGDFDPRTLPPLPSA